MEGVELRNARGVHSPGRAHDIGAIHPLSVSQIPYCVSLPLVRDRFHKGRPRATPSTAVRNNDTNPREGQEPCPLQQYLSQTAPTNQKVFGAVLCCAVLTGPFHDLHWHVPSLNGVMELCHFAVVSFDFQIPAF